MGRRGARRRHGASDRWPPARRAPAGRGSTNVHVGRRSSARATIDQRGAPGDAVTTTIDPGQGKRMSRGASSNGVRACVSSPRRRRHPAMAAAAVVPSVGPGDWYTTTQP